MRSIAGAIKTLILILVFASGISQVLAAPPVIATGSAFVTDNPNVPPDVNPPGPPDGIARIGDTVSFTVYFESNIAVTSAFAVVPGVNDPNLPFTNIINIGGSSYTASLNWTVVQGTANDETIPVRFLIGNADGTVDKTINGVTYRLDNVRPQRAGIMTASVTSILGTIKDYTGLPVIKGEKVSFYQRMTTTDLDQSASLDLGNVFLAAVNPMARTGSPPLFSHLGNLIPDNLDGTYQIPISVIDGRGNQSDFTNFSLNVDTEAPFVTACTVQNLAGTNIPALPGHILRFDLQLGKFDNDIAKVTCASFASLLPPIILPTLTPTNTPATQYTATLLLEENQAVFGNQYPFVFEITDNAGNITLATATLFSIDLAMPDQQDTTVVVYPPAPATDPSPSPTIASAGTRLQLRTEITSEDILTVTANLTALGGPGPASFPLSLATDPDTNPKTYIGTYTLATGTPVDGSYLNFTVYGKDPAGNLVFKTTTPDIFIDTVRPVINNLTLTRPGGAAPPIIAGDVVIVQATVTGVNSALGGKVWADLSALGGATDTLLEKQTDNLWRTTINVATGSLDITEFFRATAWDDSSVKNENIFDTAAILVDTEPPVFDWATYTSVPAQNPVTHPYVVSGDVVTFQVKLASTTSNIPYDGQTVTIDLSTAGGNAAQVMTLQPSGIYTVDFTVPNNNNLIDGATFPLVIRDNAGNLPIASSTRLTVYPTINIPQFDQGQPVITAFTVTRNAGAGTIRIGDTVTFTANVTGVRQFQGGAVFADLTSIGASATTAFTNAGGVWSATAAVASGSLDTASHIFTVTAYNRIEHAVSRNSAPTAVDNEPPVVNPLPAWGGNIATWSVTPPLSLTHAQINNGDLIKFEIRLASTTLNTPYDSQTVQIDLSSAGGSPNQTMTLLTNEIYTCTFTVPLGTLTDGATFPLIIRDVPGNGPYSLANGCGNQPIIASISLPFFDQTVPVISSFTLTRDAGAGTIHINDAVTFRATVDGILSGGVVWADLRKLGVPDSASYTFINVSGNIWQAKVTVGSGTIDANNASFTVNAYNRIDHQTSFGSPGYVIDNLPPFLVSTSYTSSPPQSPTHPYVKIGDQITLIVNLDEFRPNDGHTVSVDLTGLGSGTAFLTPEVPYNGTYTLTFPLATGTTNDSIVLPLTIRDNAGNTPFGRTIPEYPIIASITINLLDQLAPTISAFTVTRDAGAGIILLNDAITFNATIANVEEPAGAVWLDLRRLGGPAVATFSNIGGNSWQYSHIVGTGTNGLPAIDQTNYVFTLYAYDKASNTFALNSSPTDIDNIAPEMADPLICTWTPILQRNPPYMIIEDRFRIRVQLKTPNDNHKVEVDLSSLGNLGTQTLILTNATTGMYESNPITIATGPLNLGATFTITIRDNNGTGNGPVHSPTGIPASSSFDASATIPLLDQNPPDPGLLTLAVARRLYEIDDTSDKPTLVNTHKELEFQLPFTAESYFDDHATATVDLYYVGSDLSGLEGYVDPAVITIPATTTARFGKMIDNGDFTYRLDFDAASLTANIYKLKHQFVATMYDRSGNKVISTTNSSPEYRVDCHPPTIASISAVVVNNGVVGGVAHVGSTIRFRLQALDNLDEENNSRLRPTIDLSSLGITIPEVMGVSTPTGWYQSEIIVQEGNFDGSTPASWVITLQDGGRNFVASHTNEIAIDNQVPQVSGNMSVAWNDAPENDGKIKLGDQVTYTISLPTETALGTATLDLTAIGGPTALEMNISGTDFVWTTYTNPTTGEYANYRFRAVVTDLYGNTTNVESNQILSVDCQPASFTSHGIAILQNNGDNPIPTVSNINDIIVVYASISASLDAVASATISTNSTFITAIATGTMIFNPTTNRHEARFTVGDNFSSWSELDLSKIDYRLSAVDDAYNNATTTIGSSAFTVKNKKPELASFVMWLSPNMVKTLEGTDYFLNVASGSTVDLLLASATLKDNATVTSAYLDLSDIPGAPARLAMTALSGSVASTATGVNLSAYAKVDQTIATFSVTLLDEAGNPATGSQTFIVDTKQPAIESAQFDGTTISIALSEDIYNTNINMWRLVGSNTIPVGSVAKLELSTYATDDESFTYYYLNLTEAGRKTVAQWASTPLYLEILATDTPPLTDYAGNWLPKASYHRVTITDSTWREPAKINNLVMTHSWPTGITLDFYFNKPMATATSLVASDAVLFVNTPTGITDPFDQVDYRAAYCFQASDTVSWSDEKTMRIVLCADGRDWIARKLGAGTKTLKFAQRNDTRRFVKDDLDKPLTYYPYNSPIVITDNRSITPIPTLTVKGTPKPYLNLGSGTLALEFSDRALLFANDYKDTDDALMPSISEPVPTAASATTSFKKKIHLYNMNTNGFVTLACKDLSVTRNSYASNTAFIELTPADITGILNLYTASVNPTWGIKIDAGAFVNMWGTNSNVYLPLGPGSVMVSTMPAEIPAALQACAVTDMPPTRENTGNFIFEFELTYPQANGVNIPFATGLTPTAAIFRQIDGARVASGTFTGWSTRVVNGVTRTVAAFKTAEAFQAPAQLAPAYLELFGIKDVFDNPINGLVASYVYNSNDRITTGATGFSTASAAFVIDNVLPTVVTISPADAIGVTNPSAGIFNVDFSEPMDTAVTPVLACATSGAAISFSFNGWSNGNTRAVYKNIQAITLDTRNGTWTYTLTGGADTAGNQHSASTQDVQILTDAPPIAQGGITLLAYQNTISSTRVSDQPFNFTIDPTPVLAINYQTVPTKNLPHRICFFDANSQMLGSAPIVLGTGKTATATFINTDFAPALGNIGPTSITVRAVDSAGNLTGSLKEIVYDAAVPNAVSLTLSGMATHSAGIYYYNNITLGNMTANATCSNATDPLRLTVYAFVQDATSTVSMNYLGSGKYDAAFGTGLIEDGYAIGLADAAGNLQTGSPSLTLVVDNTAPTVASITPSTVIGNTPARMATFTVFFNEPMEPSAVPTLVLATSTAMQTIYMDFTGWVNPAIATAAQFVNRFDIGTTFPSGIYRYSVTGGTDLAANALNFAPATPFTLDVQSQGPAASIDISTLQPAIYDTKVLKNAPYSTLVNSSASIQLTYNSGPFNTPHSLLVYGPTGAHVATFALDAANGATFPGAPADWFNGTGPVSDGRYSFRLRDSLGNIAPAGGYMNRSLYLDTASATITAFNFNDKNTGIATGGITYYAPKLAGSATVTLISLATDSLRLIASGTATYTFDLASSTTTHTGLFGGSLPDGLYQVTVADFAGNFSEGATATRMVMVDNSKPFVTAVTPATTVGYTKAGTGNFVITFSEPMNTSVAPNVRLATSTKEVQLTVSSWLDASTCLLVAAGDINETFPAGTYSYLITNGKDCAGNIASATLVDEFTVGVYARGPVYTASLFSQQFRVSTETVLLNQPFSNLAEPGIATLSVAYSEGPFSKPHQIKLYDSNNILVKTVDLADDGNNSVASVTSAFFNNPVPVNGKVYKFRIVDSLGNLSATSSLNLVYDTMAPDVATMTLSNVSGNSSKPVYYHNPALHGGLLASIETTNASDAQRLLLTSGTATCTYRMTAEAGALTRHAYTMSAADNSATILPDGGYAVTTVDLAGNFAVGTDATAWLIIDRAAPEVTAATISNGLYLSSGAAGAATFTLTFNEQLSPLTTPSLSIATTSQTLACRCVSYAGNQAVFTTSAAVTNAVVQGAYNYRIKATDMTGNVLDTATGSIMVRSRGPVIASMRTESQQTTIASGTETLVNQPFSFLVSPGAATLSVQLTAAPDGDPNLVHLHYFLDNVSVASYPLALNGNAATFTWNAISGPQPAMPTTYAIYLADTNGDLSLETLNWRVDNATPTVAGLTFSGGENNTASSTIYFNPFRHPSIVPRFQTPAETEAPRMRVRSSISTDTYQLAAAGTGYWSTSFTGISSRSSNRLPDGQYDIGLVDPAGNLAASGSENLYKLIIDSANPTVSTYSLYVASHPVTVFSPSAGNLDIFAVSADPLTATGVYQIEIYNVGGTRIGRLPLVASAGAYLATWDGRNDQGNLVADGDYTFKATDYTGNSATATARVKAITSEFKVSGIAQVSSMSARIWFNQELNVAGIGATSVTASPALTISSVTVADSMSITFNTTSAFSHGVTYTISVASGSAGVRSLYGSSLTGTGNQITLTADGKGPLIATHNFSGITSQKEFNIVFDEACNSSTAGNTAAYLLTNADGVGISISQATLQADQKTVKLVTDIALTENQTYTVIPTGVTDLFGNLSPATPYEFQGRDLTPPAISVSAFSNPANENDIIVLATSNEKLVTAPTLYVKHGSASTVTTIMQARSGNMVFMSGVSLNSANGSTGKLIVRGEDLSGNQGSGEGTFTIAYVSMNVKASILSADSIAQLDFHESSLKADAVVKILQHNLEHVETANGQLMASMQQEYRQVRGLRYSQVSGSELQNSAELVPETDAYEISIASDKIDLGFSFSIKAPAATDTTGLGLFNQNGNAWKFVTADLNADGAFAARMTSAQMLAVMRDTVAPAISLDTGSAADEPFKTARPEFTGRIAEAGSGLAADKVSASIDGGLAQPVIVDSQGRFVFKPLAELTSGNHDLIIRASDRTGNNAQSAAIRFQIKLPLQITQIMQYPNPASRRGYIRISANSGDLNDDLVTIRIYDTAGHKVASLGNVRAVKENYGTGSSRYLYDVLWDLRNEDGKQVANGVYLAKVEVRDPLNPAVKVKKTCKLAVLR